MNEAADPAGPGRGKGGLPGAGKKLHRRRRGQAQEISAFPKGVLADGGLSPENGTCLARTSLAVSSRAAPNCQTDPAKGRTPGTGQLREDECLTSPGSAPG